MQLRRMTGKPELVHGELEDYTTILESDLFVVTVQHRERGTNTYIESLAHAEETNEYLGIDFDGVHNFFTDDLCLEQFTRTEVLDIIRCVGNKRYNEGKWDAKEIMVGFIHKMK